MKKRDDDANLQCSFCGKGQREVKKVIAGPTVFICDECIELCNDIIAEEYGQEETPARESRVPKPKEIREALDDYVIGQGQGRVLSLPESFERFVSGGLARPEQQVIGIDNPVMFFDRQGGYILEEILGQMPVTNDSVDVGDQPGPVFHETFYRC